MIYIADILSIFNGKVNPDAKEQLGKLKETDQLIILSDSGDIVVNSEFLKLLCSCKGSKDVVKCSGSSQIVFMVGKYMGTGESVRVAVKNPEITKSLDFLKNEEKVSFGWKANTKKKTRSASKKTVVKEEKEDDFMSFEAAEAPVEGTKKPRKRRAASEKSEDAAAGSLKESEKQDADGKEVKLAKEILGEGYRKAEYAEAVRVVKEASDVDTGLEFLCKLRLSIPYTKGGDEFMEKMKELYSKIRK